MSRLERCALWLVLLLAPASALATGHLVPDAPAKVTAQTLPAPA